MTDARYALWREKTILMKDLNAGNIPTEARLTYTRRINELDSILLAKHYVKPIEVMIALAKRYWNASLTEENPERQAAYLLMCIESCVEAGIKPLEFMQQKAEYFC